MLRWIDEIWHRRKSIGASWGCPVGAIVLVVGCQSTQTPAERTDPRPRNPQSVSVYPPLGSSSAQASPTNNGSSTPDILPVQALERVRSGGPPLATGDSEGVSAKNDGYSLPMGAPNALNLDVALRLAGVDNPTINLAQETIREALAQQLHARVLMVPNLNVGGNYHYHSGNIEASSGQIRTVNDRSFYTGFGAGAVGTGTIGVPGLWLVAHLGDAIYEPQAARENVVARWADAAGVRNAVMGDVVTAYLRLVGSEARLNVLQQANGEGAEVVRLTAEFAKAGQGRAADANRASAFNNLVARERHAAEEDVAVASAELCRLLNIDPSNRLRTPGASLEPFRLIPEDTDAESLIARALETRPELATRFANIRAAQIRVRQEKTRPFLPRVIVGVSTGAFGGESNLVNQGFTKLAGRTDIDAAAVWNVQNLGFGNRARVRGADATVGEAVAEYDATKNQIRREVLDALAETRTAARQLEMARAAVLNSAEGFELDLQRIKGGVGVGARSPRPIDLLDSFNQILESRQALVAAVATFDIAQFRLFVAVGSNPLTGPDSSRAAPAVVPTGPMGTGLGSPQPMPIPMMPSPQVPSKP